MQRFLFHCSLCIDALLILKHVASCVSVSTWSHGEVASLAAARTSNLKCFIDFLPARPGDLIANSQPPSPLIKRCTKDLSFRLFGRLSAHLDLQFLSSPLMKYWRSLSVTISAPLLSACHGRLFMWPAFWSPPASLRKSSADARWPSDLCLATDA